MIDATSMKILQILQEKARIPNVEVARQLEMAPSAVLERIRKLERQQIIDGYEVRLNPEQFNRRQVAFIQVLTAAGADHSRLGEACAAIAEVQEVHYVAGEDSFLLKVRVADTRELGHLLQKRLAALPGVKSTRTSTVLHTYKESAKLPLSDPSVTTNGPSK
ncbi:Lrp/AsnC family transcriptional regulator [Desulfogranum mediterraneum]|uniref:Lrp/AsnC family transcriptional regulator n=1 Tax=Desulfogranum mediterraneum TaxID=160661 RepID=UPI0004910556|nr:Lrp/AsnC family transcriptional regulator [Desulfogranum mediterraneum]